MVAPGWKQYVRYSGTRSGSKFLYCLVCLSMCWHHHTCVALSTGGLDFEVDKEPLTVRPPRHRCCHQEPTGSLSGMQFSFSLDVSSDIYVLLRAWRPCRATALSGQSIVYACIWQMMLSFYAHYDGTLHSALELCVTSIQICLTIRITNIQWCSDHSVLLFVVSPMCEFLHVYSCITNVWVSSCIQCVSSFIYTVVSPMCEFLQSCLGITR